MAEKAALKKLPPVSISLLGSGVMHWSKDKQIDVIHGKSPSSSAVHFHMLALLLRYGCICVT